VKRRAFFVVLFALVVTCTIISFKQLKTVRQEYAVANQMQQVKPIVPPALARLVAGEFKGIMADFMTIEAASAIGSYLLHPDVKMKDLPDQAWDVIFEILQASQALDPYFKDNYQMVQAFFTWDANRPQQAIDYLMVGSKARYWDWSVPYGIGFDYFYFLDDKTKASHYLQEAYGRQGGGLTLATLSAKLLQKAGKTKIAIAYLSSLLNQEEQSDQHHKAIAMRLKALQGVLVIEKAMEHFFNRFNRKPESIKELHKSGFLPTLPPNPYNVSYCIDGNGAIQFDMVDCPDEAMAKKMINLLADIFYIEFLSWPDDYQAESLFK